MLLQVDTQDLHYCAWVIKLCLCVVFTFLWCLKFKLRFFWEHRAHILSSAWNYFQRQIFSDFQSTVWLNVICFVSSDFFCKINCTINYNYYYINISGYDLTVVQNCHTCLGYDAMVYREDVRKSHYMKCIYLWNNYLCLFVSLPNHVCIIVVVLDL